VLQRAYLGARARDGVLTFDPRLAEHIDGLAFTLVFQGSTLRVSVSDTELCVEVQSEGFTHPVRIGLGGQVRRLGAGERCQVPLAAAGPVTGAGTARTTEVTGG
jgi:trehalose/maltose hydrolase-like predicted phosphorylase